MKKHILCIIDVQAPSKYWPDFVDNIIREIISIKKKQSHIIVVEYGSGETARQITDAIGKVHYSKVRKQQTDGSGEILVALAKNKIEPIEIVVVGQHTKCCVLHTVATSDVNTKKGVSSEWCRLPATLAGGLCNRPKFTPKVSYA